MADIKTINDEELSNVTGGANTGDVKKGKVYISFPFPYSIMSKYYGVDDVEDLANQFYSYKDQIQPYITEEIKAALINLYSINGSTMSDKVKEFLGL